MSITTEVCNTFKREVMDSTILHTNADVYKLALIKPASAGALGAATTNYTDLGADEVAAALGYTAGGVTLTGNALSLSAGTMLLDFADASWSGATFATAGALLYNSSKANRAVAVLSFGGTFTGGGGVFTVPMTNPLQAT